ICWAGSCRVRFPWSWSTSETKNLPPAARPATGQLHKGQGKPFLSAFGRVLVGRREAHHTPVAGGVADAVLDRTNECTAHVFAEAGTQTVDAKVQVDTLSKLALARLHPGNADGGRLAFGQAGLAIRTVKEPEVLAAGHLFQHAGDCRRSPGPGIGQEAHVLAP